MEFVFKLVSVDCATCVVRCLISFASKTNDESWLYYEDLGGGKLKVYFVQFEKTGFVFSYNRVNSYLPLSFFRQ